MSSGHSFLPTQPGGGVTILYPFASDNLKPIIARNHAISVSAGFLFTIRHGLCDNEPPTPGNQQYKMRGGTRASMAAGNGRLWRYPLLPGRDKTFVTDSTQAGLLTLINGLTALRS